MVPMSEASGSRQTVAVCAIVLFLTGFGGSILFVALPGIASEFHADVGNLANLGSVLSLGSAIAVPLAVLADRRRRGPIAAVGIAGFSAAAAAAALASNLGVLGAARVVAVCFETLVASVATAAALEAVSGRMRARTASVLALAGGAGGGLSVIAYPLVAPHWRQLYALAAVGILAAPLALRISDRARANPSRGSARILLGSPWRGRVALLGLSGALGALLYEPANFFAVFFGSHTLGLSPLMLSAVLVVSGLAAATGYVAGGYISDRFGRRLPSVAILLVGAVVTAITFTRSASVYLAGNIAWSGLLSATAPMIAAWTVELVPSRARVTAFTVTGVIGSVGGVAGLQLVRGLSPGLGLSGTLWLTAGAAMAGTMALLWLPETRGSALPD
jgi:MFS family permease